MRSQPAEASVLRHYGSVNLAGRKEFAYTGYTTVLTASTTVLPNQPYTINITAADETDGKFDSVIFVGSQSFQVRCFAEILVGSSKINWY